MISSPLFVNCFSRLYSKPIWETNCQNSFENCYIVHFILEIISILLDLIPSGLIALCAQQHVCVCLSLCVSVCVRVCVCMIVRPKKSCRGVESRVFPNLLETTSLHGIRPVDRLDVSALIQRQCQRAAASGNI